MRYFFALLLAAFLPAALWAQSLSPDEKYVDVTNLKDCGLISRIAPNLLPSNCFQSVQNVYFDDTWAMTRRQGSAKYNLTACTGGKKIRGLWTFDNQTSGLHYLIAYSNNSMFYSAQDGTCSAITGLTNLSTTAEMECVQTLGYLWCTNGTDPVFYTNVSSTGAATGAPVGNHIGAFRNRVLIGGVSGSQSQLYLSGELNGNDWALSLYPNISTSPAIIDIAGANDGNSINCLMGQFQNQFLIGRNYDLYALTGYNNADFRLRKVSEQIGCIEPKSVQEVNNVLYWMSKRGIEGYTGTIINPVSYPITPNIDQIISAAGNSRSQTLTTQADWQTGNTTAAGTGFPMSTAISPANVVPSSVTRTDTNTADFEQGTVSNASTNTVNSVYYIQPAGNTFINSGAEQTGGTALSCGGTVGQFGSYVTNWACAGLKTVPNSVNVTANTPYSGTYSWVLTSAPSGKPGNITFVIMDTSGTVISTNTYSVTDGLGWTTATINLSTFTQTMVVLQVQAMDEIAMRSAPFIRPASLTLAYKDSNNTGSAVSIGFDVTQQALATSGNFISRCLDTGLTVPRWGDFTSDFTRPVGTDISYEVQSATSCTGSFQSLVSQATGSIVLADNKQVIKYKASFSVTAATLAPVGIHDVSLLASTTGYYIGPCIALTGITSWGNIDINGVSNGGSFTFEESTGAWCNATQTSTATWNTITANTIPSIPIAAYTATRVGFVLATATNIVTLNDITYNWNAGSLRPPVASATYKDRYYLFYTTDTVGSPHNDKALVYDYNKKWTYLDNINAYSATKYLNQLYTGDSTDTGFIYLQDTGQDDNASSYAMSFRTADMDMGTPMSPKAFDRAYLMLSSPGNSTYNISMSCSYNIDGSTTSYSLGTVPFSESPEPQGYFIGKLQFPAKQQTTGHWINLSCTYTGTNGPVSIYGIRIVYRENTWN